MLREQQLLIKLLSVALGSDKNQLPIDNIEWASIVQLSEEQEVYSIALDGYQFIHDTIGNQSIDQMNLLNWIGNSLNQETLYDRQLHLATELSAHFYDQGLLTYVLKGVSIAQCYPNAKHRFSCDFDCFLVGKDEKGGNAPLKECGDKFIESKGIVVNRDYYKNSSFQYKELLVENHQFCCSVKRGKRTKNLEKYLEKLLLDNNHPKYIEGTKIALPPVLFQALFLIEHANGHFLYEKMSLKNICDWAVFRRKNMNQLDWSVFDSACKKYGLKAFADTLGRLADYVLGQREYNELTSLDKKVLDDTLKQVNLPKNIMLQRIIKGWHVVCSSWKFKYFSSDSMMKELIQSIYAYLFETKPVLE